MATKNDKSLQSRPGCGLERYFRDFTNDHFGERIYRSPCVALLARCDADRIDARARDRVMAEVAKVPRYLEAGPIAEWPSPPAGPI